MFMSYSVGHGEINIYSCFAAVYYTLKIFFSYGATEAIWFSHLFNEETPIYFRGMSYQGTNLIMLSEPKKQNMTEQSCF